LAAKTEGKKKTGVRGKKTSFAPQGEKKRKSLGCVETGGMFPEAIKKKGVSSRIGKKKKKVVQAKQKDSGGGRKAIRWKGERRPLLAPGGKGGCFTQKKKKKAPPQDSRSKYTIIAGGGEAIRNKKNRGEKFL